jgi:hypothetical protein
VLCPYRPYLVHVSSGKGYEHPCQHQILALIIPYCPLLERSPGDAFWTTRLSINNALTRFQRSMPDLYGLRESPEDAGGNEPSAESRPNQVIYPTLFLVKNTILSAVITLHDIDANNDASEYAKCLEAARAMANIARCVKTLPALYAHICLGVSRFRWWESLAS